MNDSQDKDNESLRAPPGTAKGSSDDDHWHMPQTVNYAYSRFVRILRKSFIGIAVILMICVAGWLMTDSWRMAENEQDPRPKRAEGEAALMNPQYDGVDKENRIYRVTADRAVRSTENADLINMNKPVADLFTHDDNWLAVKAETGDFDQAQSRLVLNGNAKFFYDEGMEFSSETVTLNLNDSTAVSKSDVAGQGPSGRIDASGMTVTNAGENIVFDGPAHLRLRTGGNVQQQERE